MNYGSTERVEVTDDNGSTKLVLTNFYDKRATGPIRTRYAIKQQVFSQREEHEAYLKFSDEIKHNPSMLDPEWKIERTKTGNDNGFYYVTKLYTTLDYSASL